jgi:hypothetical protein
MQYTAQQEQACRSATVSNLNHLQAEKLCTQLLEARTHQLWLWPAALDLA